jgi:hypothetical protein
MSDPVNIDFIEAGAYQAVRALSDARIRQIATIVAHGITAEDTNAIRRKRLMALFGELDDDEVLLLTAYGRSYGGRDREAWDAMERPGPIHLQSTIEEIDQDALYELGRDHLLRLGLLERKFPNVKKGTLPDFDASSGTFKGSVQISYLGRMFLHEIGVLERDRLG